MYKVCILLVLLHRVVTMNGSKNIKFEFLVEVNISTDRFVALDIAVVTYQKAQCYSSRHHRVITRCLVTYHCRVLAVSKVECKAVPKESKLSSRSLRVKAIDFGGRGIELPRQIHLTYLCSTMILITMQFSASGKRKVNKSVL
jgi:hypothetical protein